MRSGRLLTVAMTGAAMLTAAAPAQAQRWHGHHHGRHHHGGGIDGGDVLLGALLVGGAVAVASAVDKGNDRYDAPPPPPPPSPPRDDDYSYDGTGYDGGGYYADGYDRDYRSAPDIYGSGNAHAPARPARGPVIARENDAVDACATAAEDRGRRAARLSHVEDITDVDRNRSGWYVQGTIELRDGYRDAPERERQFRCDVASGTVPDVRIEGLDYGRR